MAVIAIDFDNTMFVLDKPLPGLKDAINLFREKGHKIVVHSCNNRDWIEKCLNNHDIRFDYICGNDQGKPIADLYVDDKGYHFPYNGDWAEQTPKILERLTDKDNRKWLSTTSSGFKYEQDSR